MMYSVIVTVNGVRTSLSDHKSIGAAQAAMTKALTLLQITSDARWYVDHIVFDRGTVTLEKYNGS